MRAFRSLAANQSTASSTASQEVVLNRDGLGVRVIRFANIGTVPVFIEFGFGAGVTAAAATSFVIPINTVEYIAIPNNCDRYDLIASGGGSTLYSTVGELV